MDGFGGRFSTPRSLSYVSWSSEANTTRGSSSDSSEDVRFGASFRMNHLHAALPGVGRTDEGHYGCKQREPHPVRSVYAASGHGQVISPAWRFPHDRTLVGDVDWAPLSPGRSSDGGGGGVHGFAYCLDRGNGQFTRLIPADVLPPLNEIPATEANRVGMVVLPPLQAAPPRGAAETNQRVTVKHGRGQRPDPAQAPLASGMHPFRAQGLGVAQKNMGRITAISIPTSKRSKIYCDKWIHEGVCAFTQQGCKFKHEMPADEQTQRSLGLFQGLPSWWRKRQDETTADLCP
ncbi:Uncharacterized protein TCAP_03829 [Tolypocladium capitatum]|uniref:C3H1-type domain-containing protein n=1 Tax=Tolypocladium capitatum TaxID=45235 RepID=A0A2K3QFF2_9HYPO|nr:Uncharacterized protein TCAP_03829 [Tolypocladium capitatum]